ncbi:MAG: hypothetical protein WCC36_08205 [Gammaproteobacteria bacterium]
MDTLDLNNKQAQRYWASVLLALPIIVVTIMCFMFAPLILILYIKGGMPLIAATAHKSAASDQYAGLASACIAIGGVVGGWAGYALWKRLVVQTGFMDKATYDRLLSGRAPTLLQERTRKSIGYLLYYSGTVIAIVAAYRHVGLFGAALPFSFLLYLIYLTSRRSSTKK